MSAPLCTKLLQIDSQVILFNIEDDLSKEVSDFIAERCIDDSESVPLTVGLGVHQELLSTVLFVSFYVNVVQL